ncbi:MAG: hypothetical protein ACRBBP_06655 [Bdellovibrionales bacterium]
MKTLKYVIYLLLFSGISSLSFGYSTSGHLVKIDADAAQGNCLPPSTRDPNSVLRQSGIEVYTARNRPSVPGGSGCQSFNNLSGRSSLSNPQDPRLGSLARVISTLNTLGDGRMTAHKNLKVVFGTVRGPSRQCADHIQLNPGSQNCIGLDSDAHGGVDNVALIAHEIGHQVANANEQEIFRNYTSNVSQCRLTSYAVDGGRGEEFAEVFGAYVTNPSLFQDKGANCRKAFEFLANLFGETPERGIRLNMTCPSRRVAVLTALERQRLARELLRGSLNGRPRFSTDYNQRTGVMLFPTPNRVGPLQEPSGTVD